MITTEFKRIEQPCYSPQTILHYIHDLQLFKKAVAQPWETLHKKDVGAFVERQLQQTCSARTINRRLHAIKGFYRFLNEEEDAQLQVPVKSSHFIRVGRPLPKNLNDPQIEQFFATLTDIRDRTLFTLMLHCGLRVAEVAQLKYEEVNIFAQEIRFFGKGRKERCVPLSNETLALVKKCIQIRPSSAPLFFWNKKQPTEPIKINSIQRLLKRYAQKAHMDLHCHLLRHTFARQMTEKGMPRTVLRDLMGHASISSTDVYGKLSDPFVKETYFNAMEKIECEFYLKNVPIKNQ